MHKFAVNDCSKDGQPVKRYAALDLCKNCSTLSKNVRNQVLTFLYFIRFLKSTYDRRLQSNT